MEEIKALTGEAFDLNDHKKLVELAEILEQLWICTDHLQGDGITVTRILPALTHCIEHLDLPARHRDLMQANPLLPPRVFFFKSLQQKLITRIKERFANTLTDPLFTISSILDPNFGMRWIKIAERSEWLLKFKQVVTEIDDDLPMFDKQARDNMMSKRRKTSPQMAHFTFYDDDEQPNAAQERLEYSLSIDRQIERMFEAQQKARERARLANGPDAKVDPLQFWKEHSLEFRAQNVMVLKYFGIPATSATVERLFSKTSFILRKHRRSMSEKLAKQLFFLKENYFFIKG
jgi:hypothetical protein